MLYTKGPTNNQGGNGTPATRTWTGSLSAEGYIVSLDRTGSDLLGWTAEEVKDTSFFAWVHPDDTQKARWVMEQSMRLMSPIKFNLRLKVAVGRFIPVRLTFSPDDAGVGVAFHARSVSSVADVFEDPGEPNFVDGCAADPADMAEHYWAQTAFEAMVVAEQMQDSWRIIRVNPAAGILFGRNQDDMIQGRILDLIPPECLDGFDESDENSQQGIKEAEIVTGTGERRQVLMQSSQWTHGERRFRAYAFWDISENRKQDAAFLQREQEFRALVDHSPDIIVRYDRDKRRTYVNRTFADQMGQPAAALAGTTIYDTGILTGQVERFGQLIDQVFATGKPVEVVMTPIQGEQHTYHHTRLIPELATDGRVLSVLNISRDITQLIVTERALMTHLTQAETFLKSFHGVAYIGDGSFAPRFLGGAVKVITGYKPDDFLSGKVSWRDLIHPEDFPALWEKIQKDREEATGIYVQRYRILRKDQKIRWVEQYVQYSRDEQGALMTHGTMVDITQRVGMERALEESKARYQMLVESIQDVFYILSADDTITYISPSVEDLLGYKPAEMLGRPSYDFIVPDDRKKVKFNLNEKRKGNLFSTQHRVTAKDGTYRWVRATTRPMPHDLAPAGSVYGIMNDITVEVLTKEALEKSEAQYRSLVDNIPGVFHRMDLTTGRITYISEKCRDILQREPAEFLTLLEYIQWIHPDDRRHVAAFFEGIQAHSSPYEVEYRMIMPNGDYRWFMDRGQGFGQNGTVEFIDGILTDITERKVLEDDLRRRETQFRSLVDNVPGIVYRAQSSPDREFVYLSGDFERITGYPKSDFLGAGRRGYRTMIHPEDADRIALEYEKAFSQGYEFSQEYRIIRQDGTTRWVQGTARLILEDGETWIDGIILDIHERKEAEAQIEYLTFHDSMTGLYNRNFFDVEMKRLDVERMLPLSIIIGDVNGLKLINDSLGHQMGDEMLVAIGRTIADACRKEDILCRWGGDEFAVLLPQTWPKDCGILRQRIMDRCSHIDSFPIPVSISLGMATKHELSHNIQEVIKEAEDMMYRLKVSEGRDTSSKVVYSLKDFLHSRSDETPEHVKRVKDYALMLGTALGLTEEEVRKLKLLADLHDVGKLSVPEDIMAKTSPLTEDERAIIRNHCEHGFKIIQSAASLVAVAEEVLAHHEWYDGTGYPQGLKGEQIPLLARIFAIVDAFDVMTHGRAYRAPISWEDAADELILWSGRQFDPGLVEIFVEQLLQNGGQSS